MMRNTASPIEEKIEILKTIRAAEALVTETIARMIGVIVIEILAGTIETGTITGVTIVIGNLVIVMTEIGTTPGKNVVSVHIVATEVIVAMVVIEVTIVGIETAETMTVTAGDLLVNPEDAAETDAPDLDLTVSPPREKEMKVLARKS